MKHPHLQKLGETIRQRRKQMKLSQEKLAEHCGFHRNYIGKVERGEQNLTIKNLIRIAETLDCRIYDLFEDAFAESEDNA